MNKKILIIDAHPVYIHKTEGFLAGLTFKNIILAASGKEGLKKAALENPDLVILSGMLPDAESHDVCKTIKAANRLTKIIVQTGLLIDESSIARFKESGADQVLPRKEKDLAPLQKAVENLLVEKS